MRFAGLLLILFAAVGFAGAQDTNFATGPQYLVTGDAMFLHSISTPSLSLNTPLPELPSEPETAQPATNAAYVQNPGLEQQADLFPIYYGYTTVNVVELASPETTPTIPESLSNFGYVATDAQALRHLGYGIPLGDVASYWKTHKPSVPRVYTNADIQRLHQS